MAKKIDSNLKVDEKDQWIIKKTITKDDMIMSLVKLPLEETREEIIEKWADQWKENVGRVGVIIKLYDLDTKKLYNVILHEAGVEYYFIAYGWSNVVYDRKIKEGDLVGFFWDQSKFTLNFKLLISVA